MSTQLAGKDGPVLDFSGGVGNTVIMLASAGIPCVYFGIGMMEFAFAKYRIRRLGLEQLVTFLDVHTASNNWAFNPREVLKNNMTFGTILAIDVLEHIPDWEETVKVLVQSLRPGGHIIEHSPFSHDLPPPERDIRRLPSSHSLASSPSDGSPPSPKLPQDLRVHVGPGGKTMRTAMGPSMTLLKTQDAPHSGGCASCINFWFKKR